MTTDVSTVEPKQGTCCCTTYQAHSRNIAIFLMVINFLGMFVQANSTYGLFENGTTATIVSCVVGIVTNAFLLYGTIDRNRWCLIAWLIYANIQIVLDFAMLVFIAEFADNISVHCFDQEVNNLEKYNDISSKDAEHLSPTGRCVPIAILIVKSFYLLVLIPSWIVVKKLYNEI